MQNKMDHPPKYLNYKRKKSQKNKTMQRLQKKK